MPNQCPLWQVRAIRRHVVQMFYHQWNLVWCLGALLILDLRQIWLLAGDCTETIPDFRSTIYEILQLINWWQRIIWQLQWPINNATTQKQLLLKNWWNQLTKIRLIRVDHFHTLDIRRCEQDTRLWAQTRRRPCTNNTCNGTRRSCFGRLARRLWGSTQDTRQDSACGSPTTRSIDPHGSRNVYLENFWCIRITKFKIINHKCDHCYRKL